MSQSQPNRPNLDDYVPVHERIAAFYARFPDGSLQSEVVVHTDNMIAMVARAYRTPDDIRPGIGHSSIEVPGRTPYTRGSEMENCETSAWGRAIAALGFEIKRGIASAEEVQNKAAEAPRTAQEPRKPQPVRQDAPAAPQGELGDDDWAGLIDEVAAVRATPIPSDGLSWKALAGKLNEAGIDLKDASAVSKRMFGQSKWKVADLSDEERAALCAELEPVAA
jgi:hypothetical protein